MYDSKPSVECLVEQYLLLYLPIDNIDSRYCYNISYLSNDQLSNDICKYILSATVFAGSIETF